MLIFLQLNSPEYTSVNAMCNTRIWTIELTGIHVRECAMQYEDMDKHWSGSAADTTGRRNSRYNTNSPTFRTRLTDGALWDASQSAHVLFFLFGRVLMGYKEFEICKQAPFPAPKGKFDLAYPQQHSANPLISVVSAYPSVYCPASNQWRYSPPMQATLSKPDASRDSTRDFDATPDFSQLLSAIDSSTNPAALVQPLICQQQRPAMKTQVSIHTN
ncbi:hypothetical protein T265_08587 [Opisthorchis viverrini]|uniref:Uncharacterized protein n=1 Tax=Opisthorchis viverrini TaxID=6198 RepID=A0A075A7U7_OPIVI|nr:hypothetical protein T265_08587 [Opisthorchis viverrini]KER23544.1 hypothetical protein T265_08587 [Opisthorchis viverrini]